MFKCVPCFSFLIFHPASFTFYILSCTHSQQYYVYVLQVTDMFMSTMLLCSRHGCCCVYVPDAAVVHIVDAVVFMYLTLPCLHPQLCYVHISDSAVFTLALLILPCSDPQHYCLLVPNVVVFKCPFKSLTFCVHVIMAVSRM